MKIIKNNRIFLFLPQSNPLLLSRSDSTVLNVPTKSVLAKFEAAMRQLQQDDELWRVDYFCINYATFELAVLQGSLTFDHIENAAEADNYFTIKYQFDGVGGCWELRVLDSDKMQGIWGDARLIVSIY